jgi:hypothetical protein
MPFFTSTKAEIRKKRFIFAWTKTQRGIRKPSKKKENNTIIRK